MLRLLQNWKGKVEVNGVIYDSISDVKSSILEAQDTLSIKLLHTKEKTLKSQNSVLTSDDETRYRITVKPYMTKEATPEFDFMAKWNNNIPMPMRNMEGTVVKQTRGMVYMKLRGYAKKTITCMCCGKELTNPVSRMYGIGPICLSKIGISADINDVNKITEDLENISWEGWVIRSSIINQEEIDD